MLILVRTQANTVVRHLPALYCLFSCVDVVKSASWWRKQNTVAFGVAHVSKVHRFS